MPSRKDNYLDTIILERMSAPAGDDGLRPTGGHRLYQKAVRLLLSATVS
ncbi:MAG: hypothetical protein RMZ42_06600 [Nostoc sp. DedQUE05]|nr:hypothetical protein [Nostoc sp. DedQUE05]